MALQGQDLWWHRPNEIVILYQTDIISDISYYFKIKIKSIDLSNLKNKNTIGSNVFFFLHLNNGFKIIDNSEAHLGYIGTPIIEKKILVHYQ